MAQIGSCNGEQLVGVNDSVCLTLELDDAVAPTVVWTDITPYIINGTIMVENNGIVGVGQSAALSVNGTAVPDFVVVPGEARSVTLNDINTISLLGSGGDAGAFSSVNVAFSLNYKF